MSAIRVILADDHPQIRAGMKRILNRAGDIELAGEASDGCQVIEMIDKLNPDVLIMDIEMPGMTGIQVIQQLRINKIEIPIVVISVYEDREYIVAMFSLGIAGYLVKEEAPDKLPVAIRAVADRKHKWVSRKTAAAVSTILESGQHPMNRPLTSFEMQILRMVQRGLSSTEIAKTMVLNESIVEAELDQAVQDLEENL